MENSIIEISKFFGIFLLFGILIELYFYIHFKYSKNLKLMMVFLLGFPFFTGLAYFLFRVIQSRGINVIAIDYKTIFKITIVFFVIEIIVFIVIRYIFTKRNMLPIMLIAPGFIVTGILFIFPIMFLVYLAFTNLSLYTINEWMSTGRLQFVGISNFVRIFTSSILSKTPTWWLIIRTFLYTFINVFFQVSIGMGLALLLNRKMKLKGVYRTILAFPWAIPAVVAILAWRSEFAPMFGGINIVLSKIAQLIPFLHNIGIDNIPWRNDPLWTFIMVCIVNIWIGIPFNMIVILGGLQSVSPQFYDVASIDGAGPIQKFKYITLPLIKPVLTPVILLGIIWTFNAINIVYLMTGTGGGGGSEYADLLISASYKAAFTYSNYSLAAALGVLIIIILFLFTILWLRLTKGTEKVY